jgi:hypothetical protein
MLASPYRYKFTSRRPPKYPAVARHPAMINRDAVRGHLKTTAAERLERLQPVRQQMLAQRRQSLLEDRRHV